MTLAPAQPSSALSGRDWRDLRPRLLSALALIVVAVLAISLGGYAYGLLIVATMAGMAAEGCALFSLSPRSWRGALFVAWSFCAGLSAFCGRWEATPAFAMTAFVFGPPLWLMNAVIVAGGLSLMWLRLGADCGVWAVVFVIAVVVSSDSAAYVTGRMIGGPKLAPRISPGKTRSGAVGGLLGAVMAGLVVATISGAGFAARGAGWALLLGIAAQAGDLAESAVKRTRGVKDSGRLLPGHGGLLDRFDALLAAAPLAALLSLLAKPVLPFWSVGFDDLARGLGRFLGG